MHITPYEGKYLFILLLAITKNYRDDLVKILALIRIKTYQQTRKKCQHQPILVTRPIILSNL